MKVYILECSDTSLYTGITNNINRRLIEHSLGKCRYTKGRRPIKLLGYKIVKNRSEACKLEKYLKRRTREFKREFILKPK